MSQILVELIKMANMIITITKAVACSNRIADVLAIENSMQNGTITKLADKDLSVEFCNVSFCYEGSKENAVEGITFEAKSGEIIGIIGGTASGKTSLVNLIPRFYDATKGVVKINGVDVREYDVHSLRKKIGFVHQRATLFKGSIETNLRIADENADKADMEAALKAAQIKDSVDQKGGIEAVCEQNGRNFSGGQKQRLTIARALVKKSPVLILDDSASALDYITESNLRNAIKNLKHNPTVFIVSQRASSVMHADKIIVLDDGKMVGKGTHDELLKACRTYKEIYSSQFE
jgi:ABC-type multidrug transport system fused ATPase/permease subunit